jgi:hypothetical protein
VGSSIPHARWGLAASTDDPNLGDERRLPLVAVKEFIEVSDPTESAALQLPREPRSKADRLTQYSPIWCGLMASVYEGYLDEELDHQQSQAAARRGR